MENLNLNERIDVFATLGKVLNSFATKQYQQEFLTYYEWLTRAMQKAEELNPWFTQNFILTAINNLGSALAKSKIEQWLSQYPELKKQVQTQQNIGVVNAGNIPLVGFHDFLTVLITGHHYQGKLSSKDKELPKVIQNILSDLEPRFKERIEFTEENLKDFDAIIATGSNNASRYFEYYFGKYPHIIRKNRSSAAVLTGDETDDELKALADDIFLYFGLGCRNVSKLYLPENFPVKRLFENMNHYEEVKQHHKYANNYEYNRTIYLMNKIPHFDNGFILLKEDFGFSSPIATVFYETYSDLERVKENLLAQQENLQCVVSNPDVIEQAVPYGKSQEPELWDYADNVDTMQFLLSLKKE